MSRRIFRYRLDVSDRPVVAMPTGAEVLSVGPPRDGADQLDLWAIVDPFITTDEARSFRVVGTGNLMPDDCGRFIGTVPQFEGLLIWHVFEASS
jgi:hypothetical protein